MSEYGEAVSIDTLDDLCLSRVASHIGSYQGLLTFGSTCRRLRLVVARADAVWQHRIEADFGLFVQGGSLARQYEALWGAARGKPPRAEQRPQRAAFHQGAAGGGSGDAPSAEYTGPFVAAAAPPADVVRPFLPFVGVSTDGGCHGSQTKSWVGHMFKPSLQAMYSSELGTRNVHCLAALKPDGHEWPAERRNDLIRYLQHPTAYLRREAVRSIPKGSLPAPGPLPALPPHAVEHARAELSTCTNEALEELFMRCYRELSEGRPWGSLLTRGVHQPQPQAGPQMPVPPGVPIADIHALAWEVRQGTPAVPHAIQRADPERRPHLLFVEPPMRQLLLPAALPEQPAEAADAAGTAACTEARQRAAPPAACAKTIGMFDTVLLARPPAHTATCPLRCGALFAAVATTTAAAPASGAGGVATSDAAQGAEEQRAAESDGAAAALATALNNGLAQAAHVKALSDAADARAVLSACRSGALPPAACYRTNGWIEWVEFQRPGGQQAHAVESRDAAHGGASTSGGADGSAAPAVLSLPEHGLRVRVLPVLWFRFSSRDERDDMGWQVQRAQHLPPQGGSERGGNRQMPCGAEGGRTGLGGHASSNPPAPRPARPCLSVALAAAAAEAANAALAEEPVTGASGATATISTGDGGGGTAGCPGAAAPLKAEAVPIPVAPLFPLSPHLTTDVPGVGYMYGWAALSPIDASVDRIAQLRLTQPWCANLLLAKLIDCEDAQPRHNREGGGCNIDAGIIAVQGPAPPGIPGGGPVVRLLDGVQLA